MCLIAFAWQAHPRYRLVLAGNRDEFHERPSAPLASWNEETADADRHLLAGRDLECGGTWLGVSAPDRVCVVTNVRKRRSALPQENRHSRGLLVLDYLRAPLRPNAAALHAAELEESAADYRPFNLLLFDGNSACYAGNQPRPAWSKLPLGLGALSNGRLNEPWPKTRRLRAALAAWLDRENAALEELFTPLADETRPPDAELPNTGLDLAWERLLSAAFIRNERYGTRASTLVTVTHAGAGEIIERRFGPNGQPQNESRFRFQAAPTLGAQTPRRDIANASVF